MQGTIIAYEPARRVGLIAPEDGGRNIGFRAEDVDVPKRLRPGEAVIYKLEAGDWYAARVRVLSAPRASRSRITAAVLAVLGGALGLQKFYLGYYGAGLLILVGTLVFWWLALPVFIAVGLGIAEGIIYLSLGNEKFEQRYLTGRRAWL